MGIVLRQANAEENNPNNGMQPPVEGAQRLTPYEMNSLHFGSDLHSPLTSSE